MKRFIINFIFVIILFTVSCEDRLWDNIYDKNNSISNEYWAPKELEYEIVLNNSIQLSWIQEITSVDGFIIDKKVGNLEWVYEYDLIINNGEPKQYWRDYDLLQNIPYYYSIRAYFGDKVSTSSNMVIIYVP